MASIAVGADWVFLPESPPDVEDWETSLCEALESRRKQTNYRYSLPKLDVCCYNIRIAHCRKGNVKRKKLQALEHNTNMLTACNWASTFCRIVSTVQF